MTESGENPVFGQRVPGASYGQRPSAYAVIKDGLGHVALVRTAQGVFLPGGGIEVDETPEQALLREVQEECGFGIRLLFRLPDAVQLVYSQAELAYFEKASTFFGAIVEGYQSVPSERGHEVLWVAFSEAASLVSYESHRWALRWSDS